MAGDFQKINIPTIEDKPGGFRRQYPRRTMKRKVGVLCDGSYFIVDSGEIGEGGMSIISEYLLNEGDEVVVSFQIPAGDFVFLRGVVRSTQKKQGDSTVTHGLSFSNVNFATKRQIRAFVSARTHSSSQAA
ncbi:PilZ domain-containing protein [Bdellovibrio sp. SKB1291214]|uniref:PilZ domain-containing protein n=1 Tax=Bdellovibrio sp. SKB1291214 TaxID=1732569 RepID=UPI002240B94C|nr:PilZ domain-containing protein [Bdellovibrio sp. SKB1291214]UYL09235.1 PilZ domain-containing protein [Bdellovibrio sp. SKB1291214]